MRAPLVASWSSLALGLAGCAGGPTGRLERAYFFDLRRIVEMRQRTDWVSDRAEIESGASVTLRSACQTPLAARRRLSTWLDATISGQGGSAEAVWRASGESLSVAQDVLTLERVRMLHHYAEEHQGECPFWLRENPRFVGVHGDHRRFVLLLESEGSAALVFHGRSVAFGAEASARVIPAVGVSDSVTLGTGIEIGGIGAFGAGGADRALSASVSGAVPVLLRFQNATRLFDVELAATGRFFGQESSVQPGVRLSFGYGFTTLRVSDLMPFALLSFGYEYQPADGTLPASHTLRLGTRVGADWAP
ncbi:MAG: hypothetical protein EPO40_02660 [Myxococcaceae bacterium]|nr:MAG: hypothetical protein EPO40_02660 [Myxococcaceae bacterium]